MTSRPIFAAVAAVAALLLVGLLFGAAFWTVAGLTVALMIAANHALSKAWADAATATRRGGDREVKIGSRVPVEIDVTNRGRIPLLWLLAEDLTPRFTVGRGSLPLRVEGPRLRVMMLMPGATKRIAYEVVCRRRGYFQIGPTVLETGDLMGLFRRFRVGAPPLFITVLPPVQLLTGYDIGSRRPVGEIRIRQSLLEDPTRLRGIRQWQPGDPMRSVHWAATARTGTLHSKVYEPTSLAGATLVLDLHQATNPDRNEPHRTDLAVSAAASILAALHDQGEPFAIATNGRDAAERARTEGWVGDHRVRDEIAEAAAMSSDDDQLRPLVFSPARDAGRLKELTRTLARLDRTDGLSLAELLAESESRLSSETTLIMIVQECPPESAAAIIGLARRGWAVAAILNTHEDEDFARMAAPTIAERIPTFHLRNEKAIPDLCREILAR